jgi:hypothetical protein
MSKTADLLTQFRSLARQIAEQAFIEDKKLFREIGFDGLADRKTSLDEFQEAVRELEVMIANLQLDVEIESMNQEANN